ASALGARRAGQQWRGREKENDRGADPGLGEHPGILPQPCFPAPPVRESGESPPLYFKQFYLGCLAHASYLIGSEGEAAAIDPQRDVEQYIAEAESEGLRIRYVVETHLHADVVSGHRELAERTGTEIVFGARAGASFPHRAVEGGGLVAVGSVRLLTLETQGHTPESISILVIDTADPSAREGSHGRHALHRR